MTPETLTALKASIAHHEKNLEAESPDDVALGSRHCALCTRFLVMHENNNAECGACPVKERTGADVCEGSPYYAAAKASLAWEFGLDSPACRDAFRDAERAEIEFLKSLLPEGEK